MTATKKGRGRPRELAPNMTERFMIRCTAADMRTWKSEADANGVSVGTWVRMASRAAVGKPWVTT